MTGDQFAEIALPVPLNRTFTYSVPSRFQDRIQAGMRVRVPFGRRTLTGYVMGVDSSPPEGNLSLKEIQWLPDEEPLIDRNNLKFYHQLSARFHSPLGEMIQAAMPPSFSLRSGARIQATEAGRAALMEGKTAAGDAAVLEALGRKSYTDSYLRTKVKGGGLKEVLSALERKGYISVALNVKPPPVKKKPPAGESVQLEMDFSADPELLGHAADIFKRFLSGYESSFYLYGGRSSREVVCRELIRRTLLQGRTVLFLVPEISLSRILIGQIEAKMGSRAALIHSRQTDRQREDIWWDIKRGKVDVVIGPRSALFSPLPRLGLIIVDDEHDDSYAQQESPVYDARVGAEIKAIQERALLVKGSSFPTVEAFYRARRSGGLLHLGKEKSRPVVKIHVDHGHDPAVHRRVQEAIGRQLDKGLPTLAFLNRRGYASCLLCPRCGYIPHCERCKISLSYHRRDRILLCHYCGRRQPVPELCPVCGGRRLRTRGLGIESLVESFRKLFPDKNIRSFDSDSLSRKKEQERVLSDFRRGDIHILVGTQLLVRKTDLPPASLIVVFQPESLLALADFQAGQKCFHYLMKTAGLLDEEGKGRLLIQTSLPDHYSIRAAAAGDYSLFYEEEIKFRRLMRYPPFAALAEVLLAGENLRTVAKESRLAAAGLRSNKLEVLGPAVAPTAKISGRHRVQIICKSENLEKMLKGLGRGLTGLHSRKKIILYA